LGAPAAYKSYSLLPQWMRANQAMRVSSDIARASVLLTDWPHRRRLHKSLRRALRTHDITHLFPMQAAALPLLLPSTAADDDETPAAIDNGGDVCITAPTGSGKTLCYALPLLSETCTTPVRIGAIVLLPTQQLCEQVHSVLSAFAGADRWQVRMLATDVPVHTERQWLWTRQGEQAYAYSVYVAMRRRRHCRMQRCAHRCEHNQSTYRALVLC
jgi:superfamily II DNA/RNA helicase